jgi:hypothetical protein
MRRTSGLAGLFLLGVVALACPAQAVTSTPTEFQVAVVVGEGPPPASGSRFDFYATLVDADQEPVAGVPVTLSARPYGSATYAPVAHGFSGPDGSIRLDTVLRLSSQVRWSWTGDAEHTGATSASTYQPVGSRVRAHAADSTLVAGQKVVVLGGTGPAKPGNRVTLWRGDKPAFAPGLQMTRIATGVVGHDGRFRLSARFAHAGTKRIYVRVSAGSGNAEGFSPYLRIRVR